MLGQPPRPLVGPRSMSVPQSPLSVDARSRLRSIRARLDTLATHTATWWLDHGMDTEYGGFHGTLDRTGVPCPPTHKGIIQQSRHLWALSTWHERRAATSLVKACADRTYAFIVEHFRDPNDGEFFWQVDRSGGVTSRMKKLYAESFAIYGLAAYGRVFGNQQALVQALDCFRSLDERCHDAIHGGYDQTSDPLSWINGLAKGTNTHIHLMEAFTELFVATADSIVRSRLSELVTLMAERLLQPTGHIPAAFTVGWQPQGAALVSYGHDLETAWLIVDAARVLGRADEQGLLDAAVAMGQHSAERGFDSELGGCFYEGVPGGCVTSRYKVWWVQFEAVAATFWLLRLTGDEAHLVRLERMLDYVEAARDAAHGEWFYGLNPDGTLGPDGPNKGQEWKTSYHSLRSLLFTADWIEEYCD